MNFLKKFKNFVFGQSDSKHVINSLEDFSKLTQSYNDLLAKQIETKRKKINTIKVFLSDFKRPDPYQSHSLNIELVDMRKTIVRKKGKRKSTKKMDWEKDIRNINKNRGIVI